MKFELVTTNDHNEIRTEDEEASLFLKVVESIKEYLNILIFVIDPNKENGERLGIHVRQDIKSKSFDLGAGAYFLDDKRTIRNSLTNEALKNGNRNLLLEDLVIFICENLTITKEAKLAYTDFRTNGHTLLPATYPKTRTLINTNFVNKMMKDNPTIKENENGQFFLSWVDEVCGASVQINSPKPKEGIKDRILLDEAQARRYGILPDELPYLELIFSIGANCWKYGKAALVSLQFLYNVVHGLNPDSKVHAKQIEEVKDIVVNGLGIRRIQLQFVEKFFGDKELSFAGEPLERISKRKPILQVEEITLTSKNGKETDYLSITIPDLYVYIALKSTLPGQKTNLLYVEQRLFEDEAVKLPGEKKIKKLTTSEDKEYIVSYLLRNISSMYCGFRSNTEITLKDLYKSLGTPTERAKRRYKDAEEDPYIKDIKIKKMAENIAKRDREIIERKLEDLRTNKKITNATDSKNNGYIKGFVIVGNRPIKGYSIILQDQKPQLQDIL